MFLLIQEFSHQPDMKHKYIDRALTDAIASHRSVGNFPTGYKVKKKTLFRHQLLLGMTKHVHIIFVLYLVFLIFVLYIHEKEIINYTQHIRNPDYVNRQHKNSLVRTLCLAPMLRVHFSP